MALYRFLWIIKLIRDSRARHSRNSFKLSLLWTQNFQNDVSTSCMMRSSISDNGFLLWRPGPMKARYELDWHPWQETLCRAKAHINTHNCANWLRIRLHIVQTAKKVAQLFYFLLIFCAVNYTVKLHNECVPMWSSGDWLLMGTHLLCNLRA